MREKFVMVLLKKYYLVVATKKLDLIYIIWYNITYRFN